MALPRFGFLPCMVMRPPFFGPPKLQMLLVTDCMFWHLLVVINTILICFIVIFYLNILFYLFSLKFYLFLISLFQFILFIDLLSIHYSLYFIVDLYTHIHFIKIEYRLIYCKMI